VLVVGVEGARPAPRRRLGRARLRGVDPDAERPPVPVTTLTAIRVEPLGIVDEAERWLERVRADREAVASEVAAALALINGAVHAHRTATLDPHLPDVGVERALAARIGFGDGDALAEGRFQRAIEVPTTERLRRADTLRPQERIAAVFAGRETVPACELLVLRARADLDAGRTREATLQLGVALEALLAERDELGAPGQADDLATLEERRASTGEAVREALRGEVGDEPAAQVAETLGLCERVLRRRRALG
jgi:hypothetical protein